MMPREGVPYTYDANGNTLSKADSSGRTSYTWDFENRLTSVVLPGTGGTVSFKYDPWPDNCVQLYEVDPKSRQ